MARRVFLAAVLFLVAAVDARAAAPADGDTLPYHDSMRCGDCHAFVPQKGKLTTKQVLDGLKKDPVVLCRECHDQTEKNHHPARFSRERKVPEGLPMGREGEVLCSTCHDVHQRTKVPFLLRGYDDGRYTVRMDMCLDCHGDRFSEMNPHGMDEKGKGCTTCHPSPPSATDRPDNVQLRPDLAKICNFCHNVSSKGHPANIDPAVAIPANLPRDREGKVMCGTCHEPHGSGTVVHFLRPAYVEFVEKGRYANPHGAKDYGSCKGCHLDLLAKKELMKGNLRYGGDDILICLSCHGAMDSCHPVLIHLSSGMAETAELPLGPDKRIRCTTCHDPMPPAGKGVGLRGREPGKPSNAMCFRCHLKEDLAGRNPHLSMDDKESCRFCHDTMSDPKNEEASKVSFISNTRLICLRCHGQDAHPSNVDHMVTPVKYVPPSPFKLDGKGKVTCTTCHNPHAESATEGGGKSRGKRYAVDVEGRALCSLCHRR